MSHDAHLIESEISSEAVFDGMLLHVRKDEVRLPNGKTSTREYVVHPGAVVVLAQLNNGMLLFERQFRYPLGRVFLEFPAGKRDPGESAFETGRRELAEEAGYEASTWTRLGVIHPCIGYSDEATELWRADGLVHVGSRLDDDEHLDVLAQVTKVIKIL